MTPQSFYQATVRLFVYAQLIIYGLTSVAAGFVLGYALATRRWNNKGLLLLAATVLAMAVCVVVS